MRPLLFQGFLNERWRKNGMLRLFIIAISYMYICICMYVCMYECVYVCMYVRTYVCMYVCMYVCVYVCMYACMYACMHICMYVCIYVCTYLYTPIAAESIYRKRSIVTRFYLKINGSRIHCLIIAESNQSQF